MKINKFYHYTLVFLVLIFLLVNLACRLTVKKTQTPLETISVNSEAAATLEAKVEDSVNQAEQGQKVELSLTEEEITSLLAQKLQDQSEIIISNPQVYLREGKVTLTGDFQTGKLNVPVKIVFEPQVNSAGQARLELISVNMGPFSAPDSMVTTVQDLADRFLTDFLQQSGNGFVVESITVSDGILTIKGYRP
jgi:uncharacterized protein YpmS